MRKLNYKIPVLLIGILTIHYLWSNQIYKTAYNFNLYVHAASELAPLDQADVTITGNNTLKLKTNTSGRLNVNLKEGNYTLTISRVPYKSLISKFEIKAYNITYAKVTMRVKENSSIAISNKVLPKPVTIIPSTNKAEGLVTKESFEFSEKTLKKSAPTTADMVLLSPDFESNSNVKAGMLTAGELNDFSKWELWKDIEKTDLKNHIKTWNLHPIQRYTIQVSNRNHFPIPNAHVQLVDKSGQTLWNGLTDNTGKAELWANALTKTDSVSNHQYDIIVSIDDKTEKIKNAKPFQKGINFLKMNSDCSNANIVDIAWVVDATGSMGDEIEYLKTELNDVMTKTKSKHPDLVFRLGSVFYKDFGDNYVTSKSDLSEDISKTVSFIQMQHASGGGDFPEAVDTALSVAANQLSWTSEARTRLLFLVLDAPPHSSPKNLLTLNKAIEKFSKIGVKIIPVTASGIDKSTEYLMRSLALLTNGSYVFLTDDSGIGGSHIKPTTDQFKVETLNDILIRLIDQHTQLMSCHYQLVDSIPKQDTAFVQNPIVKDSITKDSNQQQIQFYQWKYYPNPTSGLFTIEIQGQINELFITDQNGKLMKRIIPGNERVFTCDISEFPSGIYYLKYFNDKQKLDGKLILLH